MAEKGRSQTVITNRKARHEYHILETFEAGMALKGTEVKSLRNGKASLQEAYCTVENGEVFIKGMNINEYSHGNIHNHPPMRKRKLLLKKREIRKLRKALQEKGLTIIPLKVYFNERNLAKVSIGLAKGKKLYDKRQDIKERDNQRELDRQMKY
ncbi:MAG: SsrA-binding protein SmpB [Bacteroidetes bacterium]|nr:MAG: SsrA-binding protein SmpB [Bacteroidota bacterium]